ncbi:hypothetical protein OpiT1DRAFT_03306 [Opitutaceae bacterium TAV1]|nr:hypothetical protein OpiT1DRAFT_03306 [Opitutaceae bacterium TAV1]
MCLLLRHRLLLNRIHIRFHFLIHMNSKGFPAIDRDL